MATSATDGGDPNPQPSAGGGSSHPGGGSTTPPPGTVPGPAYNPENPTDGRPPDFDAIYAYAARFINFGDQLWEYAHNTVGDGFDGVVWSGDRLSAAAAARESLDPLIALLASDDQHATVPSAARLMWNIGETINWFAINLEEERAEERKHALATLIGGLLGLFFAAAFAALSFVGATAALMARIMSFLGDVIAAALESLWTGVEWLGTLGRAFGDAIVGAALSVGPQLASTVIAQAAAHLPIEITPKEIIIGVLTGAAGGVLFGPSIRELAAVTAGARAAAHAAGEIGGEAAQALPRPRPRPLPGGHPDQQPAGALPETTTRLPDGLAGPGGVRLPETAAGGPELRPETLDGPRGVVKFDGQAEGIAGTADHLNRPGPAPETTDAPAGDPSRDGVPQPAEVAPAGRQTHQPRPGTEGPSAAALDRSVAEQRLAGLQRRLAEARIEADARPRPSDVEPGRPSGSAPADPPAAEPPSVRVTGGRNYQDVERAYQAARFPDAPTTVLRQPLGSKELGDTLIRARGEAAAAGMDPRYIKGMAERVQAAIGEGRLEVAAGELAKIRDHAARLRIGDRLDSFRAHIDGGYERAAATDVDRVTWLEQAASIEKAAAEGSTGDVHNLLKEYEDAASVRIAALRAEKQPPAGSEPGPEADPGRGPEVTVRDRLAYLTDRDTPAPETSPADVGRLADRLAALRSDRIDQAGLPQQVHDELLAQGAALDRTLRGEGDRSGVTGRLDRATHFSEGNDTWRTARYQHAVGRAEYEATRAALRRGDSPLPPAEVARWQAALEENRGWDHHERNLLQHYGERLDDFHVRTQNRIAEVVSTPDRSTPLDGRFDEQLAQIDPQVRERTVAGHLPPGDRAQPLVAPPTERLAAIRRELAAARPETDVPDGAGLAEPPVAPHPPERDTFPYGPKDLESGLARAQREARSAGLPDGEVTELTGRVRAALTDGRLHDAAAELGTMRDRVDRFLVDRRLEDFREHMDTGHRDAAALGMDRITWLEHGEGIEAAASEGRADDLHMRLNDFERSVEEHLSRLDGRVPTDDVARLIGRVSRSRMGEFDRGVFHERIASVRSMPETDPARGATLRSIERSLDAHEYHLHVEALSRGESPLRESEVGAWQRQITEFRDEDGPTRDVMTRYDQRVREYLAPLETRLGADRTGPLAERLYEQLSRVPRDVRERNMAADDAPRALRQLPAGDEQATAPPPAEATDPGRPESAPGAEELLRARLRRFAPDQLPALEEHLARAPWSDRPMTGSAPARTPVAPGRQLLRTDAAGNTELVRVSRGFPGSGDRLDEAPSPPHIGTGEHTFTELGSHGGIRWTELRPGESVVDAEPLTGAGGGDVRVLFHDPDSGTWEIRSAPKATDPPPDHTASPPRQVLRRGPDGAIDLLTIDRRPPGGGHRLDEHGDQFTSAGFRYHDLDGSATSRGWHTEPAGFDLGVSAERISTKPPTGRRLTGESPRWAAEPATVLVKDQLSGRWTTLARIDGELTSDRPKPPDVAAAPEGGPAAPRMAGELYRWNAENGAVERVALRSDPIKIVEVGAETGRVSFEDRRPTGGSGLRNAPLRLNADGSLGSPNLSRIRAGELRYDPVTGTITRHTPGPDGGSRPGPSGGGDNGGGGGGGGGMRTRRADGSGTTTDETVEFAEPPPKSAVPSRENGTGRGRPEQTGAQGTKRVERPPATKAPAAGGHGSPGTAGRGNEPAKPPVRRPRPPATHSQSETAAPAAGSQSETAAPEPGSAASPELPAEPPAARRPPPAKQMAPDPVWLEQHPVPGADLYYVHRPDDVTALLKTLPPATLHRVTLHAAPGTVWSWPQIARAVNAMGRLPGSRPALIVPAGQLRFDPYPVAHPVVPMAWGPHGPIRVLPQFADHYRVYAFGVRPPERLPAGVVDTGSGHLGQYELRAPGLRGWRLDTATPGVLHLTHESATGGGPTVLTRWNVPHIRITGPTPAPVLLRLRTLVEQWRLNRPIYIQLGDRHPALSPTVRGAAGPQSAGPAATAETPHERPPREEPTMPQSSTLPADVQRVADLSTAAAEEDAVDGWGLLRAVAQRRFAVGVRLSGASGGEPGARTGWDWLFGGRGADGPGWRPTGTWADVEAAATAAGPGGLALFDATGQGGAAFTHNGRDGITRVIEVHRNGHHDVTELAQYQRSHPAPPAVVVIDQCAEVHG